MKIRAQQLTRGSVAALNEAQLRNDVLIPLFRAMGFQGVHEYHGGAGEQGKDIVMWKPGELNERVNYAVVVLTERITGKVQGRGSTAAKVNFQIHQALGSDYRDLLTLQVQSIDRCWVVTSREIKKEARDAVGAALGDVRRRLVQWIDGDELWSLVERYLKNRTLLGTLRDAHELLRSVDTGYEVVASVGGDRPEFTVRPKPGKAHPAPEITFSPKIEFADTPEGRAAEYALQDHIRTGVPVTISGEHVARMEMPEPLDVLFGPEFLTGATLAFEPYGAGGTVLCELVTTSAEGGRTAFVPAIEFRVVHGGTEELTLSNRHQNAPIIFDIVINFASGKSSLTAAFQLELGNVKQQLEAIRLQAALALGATLVFVNVATGQPILVGDAPAGHVPPPEDLLYIVLEQLNEIQLRTGVLLQLPKAITADEARQVLEVAQIVTTGEISAAGIRLSVPVGREAARRMLDALTGRPAETFYLRSESPQLVEVFGQTIELGRCFIQIAGAFIPEMNSDSLRRSIAVDKSDATYNVPVVAPVGTPARIRYERWIPEGDRDVLFPDKPS